MKGHRSRRTYAFRSGGECWAFVPHPDIVGLWMRLHLSVILAACPMELHGHRGCGAPRGVPCRTDEGFVHYTHLVRRRACAARTADVEFALGIVATIEK